MEKTQIRPQTAAQKRQQELKHRALLRAAIQAIFFVSMPGAFAAGFYGVRQIFLRIGTGSVLQLDSFTLSLLGLCGFTLLTGRFFCGYVCAFGSLGDLSYWVSGLVQKKLLHRKKQFRLPHRAVLWGQKVKYLVLLFIVAMCAANQYGRLQGTDPWEVFSRLTALHTPPEGFGIGIALFVLILIGMAVFLPVSVPDGSGVCPAAGAALCTAAPEWGKLHSGLQCLRRPLPGRTEAG